jgi:uncharacterized protein (TIGR02186 family)
MASRSVGCSCLFGLGLLLAMPQAVTQQRARPAPAPPSIGRNAPQQKVQDPKAEADRAEKTTTEGKSEEPKSTAQASTFPESVQADVSTRTVAVTSSFTGTEIVVFGAVDNSQQPSAEAGFYDVIIVVEGAPSRLVSRKKSQVFGMWLNTSSVTFEAVPSYYAIASTRPLEEIAPKELLEAYKIGFQHIRMMTAFGKAEGLSTQDITDFRDAVVRLKQKEGLYVADEYGVAFIGRSLFRSSIQFPANVSVGPFETRVYLFHNEKLLSEYDVRLNLEREGIERHLHDFAFNYPLFYGLVTVSIAIGAGLLASTIFSRASH